MSPTVLLALVSPAVAIVIGLWGFRRSTRADKLRAFFELQERYIATDVRAGRRALHRLVKDRSSDEIPMLDQDVLRSAGYSLAIMNAIAIACEGRYVDQDLVARSMGRSFAAAIESAKPYIDYLEKVRGFRPYPFAERLAAKFLAADLKQRQRPRPDRTFQASAPIPTANGEGKSGDSQT